MSEHEVAPTLTEAAWKQHIRQSVQKLRLLEADWDKKGAAPIHRTVLKTIQIILTFIPYAPCLPTFAPFSNGSVSVKFAEIVLAVLACDHMKMFYYAENRWNSVVIHYSFRQGSSLQALRMAFLDYLK